MIVSLIMIETRVNQKILNKSRIVSEERKRHMKRICKNDSILLKKIKKRSKKSTIMPSLSSTNSSKERQMPRNRLMN